MSDLYPYASPTNPALGGGALRQDAYNRLKGQAVQLGDNGDSYAAVTNILNGVNLNGPDQIKKMWDDRQKGMHNSGDKYLASLQDAYKQLRSKIGTGGGGGGGGNGMTMLPPTDPASPWTIVLQPPHQYHQPNPYHKPLGAVKPQYNPTPNRAI